MHSTYRALVPRVVAVVLLAAATALAAPAPAGAQTVIVNGRQLYLNPGPIERAGRVFVPLRSIFESLGASVVYQAGTINATKGQTTVSLTIGSPHAYVNGQPQTVDVAPFIVGATTYVPLRFVAQSLGAVVNYDNATNVVTIGRGGGGAPPPVAQLQYQRPQPGSQIGNAYPTISAQFTRRLNPNSVRVWLDGNDVTSSSGITPNGFTYTPSSALPSGMHTVRVAANDPNGKRFERSWAFVVGSNPQMNLTVNQPVNNQVVGWNFVVQGTTVGNGKVNVTVGPSGAVEGLYAGSTTAGPLGNFHINVSLRPLPGLQTVTMKVTVTNPNTSQVIQQSLQLRINL